MKCTVALFSFGLASKPRQQLNQVRLHSFTAKFPMSMTKTQWPQLIARWVWGIWTTVTQTYRGFLYGRQTRMQTLQNMPLISSHIAKTHTKMFHNWWSNVIQAHAELNWSPSGLAGSPLALIPTRIRFARTVGSEAPPHHFYSESCQTTHRLGCHPPRLLKNTRTTAAFLMRFPGWVCAG